MYDLIIIGGGPAAMGAAVYAARKQVKTLVVAKEFSGQSVVSPGIQNWIGTIEISGAELSKNLKAHVEAYAGEYVTLREGITADTVTGTTGNFGVTTSDGKTETSKTVLIATGAHRRKLEVPGAAELEHKGLTYCATCDGPMFGDMDVAVIGGGNAGFESAAQLLAYAKSVTLLDVNNEFKAEPVTVKKVLAHDNMTGIANAKTLEVTGDTMVRGLVYEDTTTGEKHTLDVTGVFVEIGTIPSTAMVANLVKLDVFGHVPVDPRTQRASIEGVWAAGDCTDGLYAQNNIAVGDAVKAMEDIYGFLSKEL